MRAFPLALTLFVALGAAQFSAAQEQPVRPSHYKGQPSATLEQAVTNFSEYNTKLTLLLEQETLSAQDLNEIHQLTYTLENALGKLQEELATLAEVLEEVHVASETADAATVKTRGRVYLTTAGKIIK